MKRVIECLAAVRRTALPKAVLRTAAKLGIVMGVCVAAFAAAPPPSGGIPDSVKGADGLDDILRNLRATATTTPVLPPADARNALKARDGLAIDLIAHEPVVRQPLYLTFDERGRMWVVQYRQYPIPAGLKVVAYDQYIRAKFDKVPQPPPHHFKGDDRVTILEDVRGDGSFAKATTFVDGLNIATAALPGRGGVWVLNPPYLLFYPDEDRTDKPGTPVVHLSGFGLEDTHSVASSLCWGPDGWIYGAHGSTVTAKVRVEVTREPKTTDFLGQAIWRYHPEQHRFEIYAEGGGNTFGVAFDDEGRVYSGTNWGTYRGLHYVQGGYYVKGWGKHGPLTNPYALGFFEHMPHQGNADRLTHTFVVYGGDTLPELQGKVVGVNSLQNRVQVTRLETHHSSKRTVEEPFLVTSADPRFRPVDVKSGPDGALYIADLYEPRINHLDPRDTWDRATGRIYRIRPKEYKPAAKRDLASLTGRELVELLRHENRWYRETALRLLGDRKDGRLVPILRANVRKETGPFALESLWALHACGGFDDEAALVALAHRTPAARRWCVRLLGDRNAVSPAVATRLEALAKEEGDSEVRSQLASSAKRLPGDVTLRLLAGLWQHEEDIRDPHLPLLSWWALEAKAESHRDDVLRLFADGSHWRRPVVEQAILERLMQRWAMAGGKDNLTACARLLELAPAATFTARLLAGLEKGFAGRSADALPEALRQAVLKAIDAAPRATALTLGLRLGHEPAIRSSLALIADEKADRATRLACIRILGEIDQPRGVPGLLTLARESKQPSVRLEALGALIRYPDSAIGRTILDLYPAKLPEADGVRAAAYNLVASRPTWAKELLARIDAGKLDPRNVPQDVVQKLALHKDAEVGRLVRKHYGAVRGGTPQQKQREILRIAKVVKSGKGDALAGKAVYANTCAKCHKLFGTGGEVGPELTGYERTNPLYWMENIVDPSASIREEYMTFVVVTTDGRTLTGVVAGQDKTTVTLKDQEGRTTKVDRARIEEMRASPVSLMPEDQLKALKDQQVRDLFAYLTSKSAP